MLKKILMGTAALTLLASTSVVPANAADSASSTITINGTVADTCTLTLAAASSGDNNASYAGNVITVMQLANAGDATFNAADTTLSFDGMCNYAHNMSLESANGGMTHDGSVTAVGGTFDDLIEYDVTANWANPVVLDASGGAAVTATDSPAGAYSATGVTVVFNIDNDGGTDPLLSGSYDDSVIIKLGATI